MAAHSPTTWLLHSAVAGRPSLSDSRLLVRRARDVGATDVLAALAWRSSHARVVDELVERDAHHPEVRTALLGRADLGLEAAQALCAGLNAGELERVVVEAASPAVLSAAAELVVGPRGLRTKLAAAVVSSELTGPGAFAAVLECADSGAQALTWARRWAAERASNAAGAAELTAAITAGVLDADAWSEVFFSVRGVCLDLDGVLAWVELAGGAEALAASCVSGGDAQEAAARVSRVLDRFCTLERDDAVEQAATLRTALAVVEEACGQAVAAEGIGAAGARVLQAFAMLEARTRPAPVSDIDGVSLTISESRAMARRAAVVCDAHEVDYIARVVAHRPCCEWVIADAAVGNEAFDGGALAVMVRWASGEGLARALRRAAVERRCELLEACGPDRIEHIELGRIVDDALVSTLAERGSLEPLRVALCRGGRVGVGLLAGVSVSDLARVEGSGAVRALDAMLGRSAVAWECFERLSSDFEGSVGELAAACVVLADGQ